MNDRSRGAGDVIIDPRANLHEASLRPGTVLSGPAVAAWEPPRRWQGIPGLVAGGVEHCHACWYSGNSGEGSGNYVLVAHSDDRGRTWSAPITAVIPPTGCRAFDPVLWVDPAGRMVLFWAQSLGLFNGRYGVWLAVCDDPAADILRWSSPRRLCDGVMMNKPIVLDDGTWALPVSMWSGHGPQLPELDAVRGPQLVVSADGLATCALRGVAPFTESQQTFDEHMVVQRHDGSLWMLVRTRGGIAESVSTDAGRSWSPVTASALPGVNSRCYLRRSSTGSLILVSNDDPDGKRRNLTMRRSDDDGATWAVVAVLDERDDVSYPDGMEVEPGRWLIIYDHRRYGEGDILLAEVDERSGLIAERLSVSRLPPREERS